MKFVTAIVFVMTTVATPVLAQVNPPGEAVTLPDTTRPAATLQQPRFFYDPAIDFGSRSMVSPMSIVINRGFSVIQMGTRYPRDPRELTWGTNLDAVIDALVHPNDAVQRQGGWWQVFLRHGVPYALPQQRTKAAWIPNYTGHVVAGGITSRWLGEYFAAKGVPHPRIAATALYMGTQFLNEVVEQQNETEGNAGTVTDLLFFDPIGVLLFQSDRVARMFSGSVRSADWSSMASVTFPRFEIQNNGQNMAYKFPLPFTDRAELLWKLGMGSSIGPSVDVGGGNNIAPTLGIEAYERMIDPETQEETVNVAFRFGVYWDRDDSLLGSVLYVPRYGKNKLTANLYPGVLPGPFRHVGIWAARTRTGDLTFGVASNRTLGLGVGYRGK